MAAPGLMRLAGRERAAWAAVAVVVLVVQGVSIARHSLTGDEQQHLLAGHQALRYGTNTLNLEHPPLVKLVAAAPAVLFLPPLAPPLEADSLLASLPRLFDDPGRLAQARLGGRIAVFVLFGLPWLASAFWLGRRFAGERAGWVLANALGLALSVLPHLGFLHTDVAVALGFALTLLAGWRFVENPTLSRAAVLGLAVALALATKFSGVLVLPIAGLALLLAPRDRIPAARRALATLVAGVVTIVALAGVYAVANRSYAPELGRRAIELYCRGESPVIVEERLAGREGALLALEERWPGAAQFATGFLAVAAQNAIGVYPSYFFGEVTSRGRPFYFPAVFVIKTPLVLLLAFAAAAFEAIRRRQNRASVPEHDDGAPRRASWALVGSAVALYLAVAMSSNYNIGARHLLPVMPLLFLPAAIWASRVGRRTALLVAALAVEAVLVAPRWVSATNLWFLGDTNPVRWALSTSDSEMRQSFLLLRDAAAERKIVDLAILYPLLGVEEARAYFPGARVVFPGEPLPPGWYAVSVILEQYVPAILAAGDRPLHDRAGLEGLARAWEPTWRAVSAGEDHGYVAGTFHLYRLR